MKRPFDINMALNGKPVRLRNGRKAYVYCIIPNQFVDRSPFTLIGVILGKKDNIIDNKAFWTKDSEHYVDGIPSDFDIMEMW
jgi:hypothetical protein